MTIRAIYTKKVNSHRLIEMIQHSHLVRRRLLAMNRTLSMIAMIMTTTTTPIIMTTTTIRMEEMIVKMMERIVKTMIMMIKLMEIMIKMTAMMAMTQLSKP